MCDPATLAGLALSAAGTVGQVQTNQSYADAVNAANKTAYTMSQTAREDERRRQNRWESDAASKVDNLTTNSSREDYDARQAAASADLMKTFDQQPAALTAETRLPGQDGANVEVGGLLAKRINEAATNARERVKALADVSGYGTAGQGRALDRSQVGNDLGLIGTLRRGSMGVSRQEQDVRPAQVSRGSSTFADILSGLGGVMTYGGSSLGSTLGGDNPFGNLFFGQGDLFKNIGGAY